MAKFGPPRIANPAQALAASTTPTTPKRVLTAAEAEDLLVEPEDVIAGEDELTTDSEEDNTEEELFDNEGDTDSDAEPEPEEGDEDDTIKDKPTKAAKVVAKGETKKSKTNLSEQQQKYWNDIGKLGTDQGKGVASLIFLAEKMVTIGAYGVFDEKQIKDLYIHFRKNSNTAAGKNREFNEGADDHTIISNAGKLRTFFKVGVKHGIEGWGKMLSVARDIHVNILRTKDERKLLRSKALIPTYEALVKVASTQMRKEKDAKGEAHDMYPDLLTPEQIKDIFIDPNKVEEEPSVQDVIKVAVKAVERVIRGKINPGTHEVTRESFEGSADPTKNDKDDNSTGYALKGARDWLLNAGERYQKGFILNYQKEQAEAKAAAEERKRKHDERMAAEAAEKAARAAKKEADKRAKAAEKELAEEETE